MFVTTSNEASFASNLVVYSLVAVDPASGQKQPALGWRHVVDENLLTERTHLEQSRQLLLFSLLPKVRRVVAWPRRGYQALATVRRAKQ